MNEAIPYEALLRGAANRPGVVRLLAALGFEPYPGGAEREDGRAHPTPDAVLVGAAGGLHALLAELPKEATREAVAAIARRAQAQDPLRPHLLLVADPGFARLTFVACGLDGTIRQLTLERERPRRSDIEVLQELAAQGEVGTALALRHARTLERSLVTRRFFRDFRGRRSAIAAAWLNLPPELDEHRDALALLFLSRLMFLYFLQREGHLAGDPAYLPALVRAPAAAGSIYRTWLDPLFFGALNRRPEHRDAAAVALGPLPYLNGGLFERHPLERKAPGLDLPDDVVLSAFELLLDRYRFTSRERGEGDAAQAGIDPEMLGRVFEELMAPAQRGATGSYYTPAPTVERLAREAMATYVARAASLSTEEAGAVLDGNLPATLDATRAARLSGRLARMRVLDPACGSGAFLLGALQRLGRARMALGAGNAREVRRDVVARALFGLDLQADAALLCALRLWLALADGDPGSTAPLPPLPNLDLRIRQGDALLDPMDLLAAPAAAPAGVADRPVRQAMARLRPLADRYLTAEPGEREAILAELRAGEARLAQAWLDAATVRLERRERELAATAREVDLFGDRATGADSAARERTEVLGTLAEARRLREAVQERGSLPFFSFAVHFADAAANGFDVILSNPPWVRAHRWPATMRRLVRSRFEVCRSAGWRRGTACAGAPAAAATQVDLALLFLERSIALLSPDGVLGMVLPAKTIRSLYGAGGRRLLLQRTSLISLDDHSLDQHALFRADAFAATIVAERRPAAGDSDPRGADRPAGPAVHVTLARRRVPPLRFTVDATELPLVPGDPESPWLLVPPGARAALRRMQRCPGLTDESGLRVRRGAFTGANDVLLLDAVEPKLGGLAVVKGEGARRGAGGRTERAPADAFEAVVECDAIAPAVRGSGISAWRFQPGPHVVWLHDDRTGAPRPAPRHMAAYLDRHRARLDARDGVREGSPGMLLRVTPDTLRPKVAWKDLAATLEAVALPALAPGPAGTPRPLVPLNTVYFIPVPAAPDALLLAAYLNSLPVRTFARAIAERAKDARFRFFAWVVAILPLPVSWRSGDVARRLLAISKEAHGAGGIASDAQEELDSLVASRYGLSDSHLSELAAFDRWLRGIP